MVHTATVSSVNLIHRKQELHFLPSCVWFAVNKRDEVDSRPFFTLQSDVSFAADLLVNNNLAARPLLNLKTCQT